MTNSELKDRFGARATFGTGNGPAYYYRLTRLEELGIAAVSRLPFSIRVLLEAMLREADGVTITDEDVIRLATWNAKAPARGETPFKPARVIMHDLSGVPCLVDLAVMRDAVRDLGGDPRRINPQIPVDLVIDHSVQVDAYGTPEAPRINARLDMARNRERFEFIRWGQITFKNLRVVPPAVGIVHQINLEYLSRGVATRTDGGGVVVFPDSVVGLDSHTPMINALGVVGWGVGGLEAEACMLGQPITILTPEVIGVKLTGVLPRGTTATDLALTVTQLLRRRGVVDKFVEFYGSGVNWLSLPDRATIANMAPEYGATMGFFPVDGETLDYLRRTGRSAAEVTLAERYYKEQGLFRTAETPDYTDTLELDLGSVEPSLAGPKRPQDRVALRDMRSSFRAALASPTAQRGFGLDSAELDRRAIVKTEDGQTCELGHGAVVIAAITSCTNTSNPSVMIGAGLLAQKAAARGLTVPPYVKTSMAPGSRVVTEMLKAARLMEALERLGFGVVGYGCTTCIGNSGPLAQPLTGAIRQSQIVTTAVLSGNRNFEGRVHPSVKANYLASPPLVVAFALAGTIDIDLLNEPLGKDRYGAPVYLDDIWPTRAEIASALARSATPDLFRRLYEDIGTANPEWNAIASIDSTQYPWDEHSTYFHKPPFFDNMANVALPDLRRARVLAMFGDSLTTDHISPAGGIAIDSPAGRYLLEHGVEPSDFNQYGARRGNHEVMMRGTFANVRLKNLMLPGVEGNATIHYPDGERMTIFDAAMRYQAEGVPLVIVAGKEYGTGSSRDWAAKGPALLGVRAVLAESFERIHRSNLVSMGVLPLQFKAGQNAQTLGLSGSDEISIAGLASPIAPGQDAVIIVQTANGDKAMFTMTVRLDTPVEVEYYANGGVLPTVLRKLMTSCP